VTLPKEEAKAVLSLGDLYLGHGKLAEARDSFESALQVANATGARDLSAVALYSLGALEYREGRFGEARARSEGALTLYRELADRRGQAMALSSLGLVL